MGWGRARAGVMLGLLGLAGASCTRTPTQLVVVVDTDLEVGVDLDRVEVSAGPDEGSLESRMLQLSAAESGPPGTFTLPLSFGVLPREGRVAFIRAVAFAPGADPMTDGPLLVRDARASFVKGRRMALPLYLWRSCIDVVCDPESTCDRGQCRPVEVAEAELLSFSPGEESDLAIGADDDAGAMDAGGVDGFVSPGDDAGAGTDAGADASTDGGADGGAVQVDAGPGTIVGSPDTSTCVRPIHNTAVARRGLVVTDRFELDAGESFLTATGAGTYGQLALEPDGSYQWTAPAGGTLPIDIHDVGVPLSDGRTACLRLFNVDPALPTALLTGGTWPGGTGMGAVVYVAGAVAPTVPASTILSGLLVESGASVSLAGELTVQDQLFVGGDVVGVGPFRNDLSFTSVAGRLQVAAVCVGSMRGEASFVAESTAGGSSCILQPLGHRITSRGTVNNIARSELPRDLIDAFGDVLLWGGGANPEGVFVARGDADWRVSTGPNHTLVLLGSGGLQTVTLPAVMTFPSLGQVEAKGTGTLRVLKAAQGSASIHIGRFVADRPLNLAGTGMTTDDGDICADDLFLEPGFSVDDPSFLGYRTSCTDNTGMGWCAMLPSCT